MFLWGFRKKCVLLQTEHSNDKGTMKAKKTTIIVLLAAMMGLTACQETLEERCQREAAEYTEKNCPYAITNEVTLDSMTFDKQTHTIGYWYTLSGRSDDAALIAQSNPRELLLNEIRNSTNMKLYKEAKYNFRYVYHSKKNKGTQLFEATFRMSDYQ